MAVNSIDSALIKSNSGKSYAGETYNYAKEQGGSIFREFEKIDTDRNSVLSSEEIIEHRNKKAKIWNVVSKVFAAVAMYYTLSSMVANRSKEVMDYCINRFNSTKLEINMILIKDIVVKGGFALFARHKYNQINKETIEMINSANEQVA